MPSTPTAPRALVWLIVALATAARALGNAAHGAGPPAPAAVAGNAPPALPKFAPIPRRPDMLFAIRNNTLYVVVRHDSQNRGWHACYGLLSLLRHRRMPDVYGSLTTITGDRPELALHERDAGSHFTGWREAGAAAPRLWPTHDFWGWALKWIAPLPLVVAQFDAEMVPWAERRPTVFWAGRVIRNSDPRMAHRAQFAACAESDPDVAVVRDVDWGLFAAGGDEVGILGHARVKPLVADLRHLLKHKYVIYLPGRWHSSSLKRMLFAGAVVFLPQDNPHESFESEAVKGCDDCFLYYNATDVCASIKHALASVSDAQAAEMAGRLAAFVRQHLSAAAVEEYMARELTRAAEGQVFEEGWAEMAHRERFTPREARCSWLKTKHRSFAGAALGWQIDEWFDDDCMIRNTTYLRYVAI